MYYLVDTNVFLHVIDSCIFRVANLCKTNDNDVCVTQTIIDELEPGYYREKEDASSKEIYTCVTNLVNGFMGLTPIKLINLSDIEGAKEELKQIRDRFYGWMKDPTYLQSMIDQGCLTLEEIRKSKFRKMDLGECELIAIAKVSAEKYWIISNDKGRVYKHPEVNIFEIYAEYIVLLTGDEWLKKIYEIDK